MAKDNGVCASIVPITGLLCIYHDQYQVSTRGGIYNRVESLLHNLMSGLERPCRPWIVSLLAAI